MALKWASLLCTCIINVVSKRDVHGSRNMFVSESCCRALGRAGTGCWWDVCKHLKRDFRKAGYVFMGFGALNFPVSHREMPNFRAALASETFPSLCSLFSYCILLCHISTNPQTSCNSSAYQNAPGSLQFPCFPSPWHKCCVMCKTEWRLTVSSFLIPRLTSLLRSRDHWGAPRTTAHLMLKITPNTPAVLDGSPLCSHSLIQYSHLK